MSVRERAAQALDDDWPAVLEALRRGLADKDSRKGESHRDRVRALVYGRQLRSRQRRQQRQTLWTLLR